jgi:hypothetical protein
MATEVLLTEISVWSVKRGFVPNGNLGKVEGVERSM